MCGFPPVEQFSKPCAFEQSTLNKVTGQFLRLYGLVFTESIAVRISCPSGINRRAPDINRILVAAAFYLGLYMGFVNKLF